MKKYFNYKGFETFLITLSKEIESICASNNDPDLIYLEISFLLKHVLSKSKELLGD